MGGEAHMDGHRLVISGGQLVNGLVQGIGQPDLVVPRIQLHPAAALPLQVLLHPVGQIGDGAFAPIQQKAVQPHTVVE